MAESVLNPYEFLGVNENSSMTEVRRAFFNLSLVCHPDKGGNATDMRTLQSAYEWIGHHIKTVKEHGDETYEQKEENFKAFLESQQEEKILAWDEVMQDALELNAIEFGALYDQYQVDGDDYTKKIVKQLFFSRLKCATSDIADGTNMKMLKEELMQRCIADMQKIQDVGCWSASIQDGYGEYLQSMPEDISVPIEETKSFGRQELIIYEEPMALPLARPIGADAYPTTKSLDDYSVGTLCDYRLAYQDTNKPLEKLEESMNDVLTANVNDRFMMLKQRREVDGSKGSFSSSQEAEIYQQCS